MTLWALRAAVLFIGAWFVINDDRLLQKLANSPKSENQP
jgi:hypothetical protein